MNLTAPIIYPSRIVVEGLFLNADFLTNLPVIALLPMPPVEPPPTFSVTVVRGQRLAIRFGKNWPVIVLLTRVVAYFFIALFPNKILVDRIRKEAAGKSPPASFFSTNSTFQKSDDCYEREETFPLYRLSDHNRYLHKHWCDHYTDRKLQSLDKLAQSSSAHAPSSLEPCFFSYG